MDCCKADHLIMKYMDKAITEQEARALNEHISVCESCKQDFIVYDEMVNIFSETEFVEAPEHFEKKVMGQIRQLVPLSQGVENALDNIWCAIWGVFSILMGVGTLLVLNSGMILEYMAQNPTLSSVVAALTGLSDEISILAEEISLGFSSTLVFLSEYLSSVRLVLAVILVTLVMIQILIYRKDKVRA